MVELKVLGQFRAFFRVYLLVGLGSVAAPVVWPFALFLFGFRG